MIAREARGEVSGGVTAGAGDRLTAALDYALRGWAVFPLRGMLPWIAKRDGGRGCHDATLDERLVRDWWRRWPTVNIGIATGAVSNLFVLDIDPEKGGDRSLRLLVEAHGPLPMTATVRTGSGGSHFYFQHVDGLRCTVSQIGPGIDTRGDGGYVVAPPSIHPNTRRRYEWDESDVVGLALPPPWLVEAAWPRGDEIVGAGSDYATELSVYGEAALRSAAENILTAPNGRQRWTLNAEAYGLGRCAASGGVPPELALDVLLTAGRGMPSFKGGDPWEDKKIEKIVKAAFAEGLGRPRPTMAEREAEWDRQMAAQGDGEQSDYGVV